MMPTSFGYIDRMSEINMLIQNNFLMIADLEKVRSLLM
jgi:hypothetical protein